MRVLREETNMSLEKEFQQEMKRIDAMKTALDAVFGPVEGVNTNRIEMADNQPQTLAEMVLAVDSKINDDIHRITPDPQEWNEIVHKAQEVRHGHCS
jgi:hypothetical protein